jgi:peptidoglycan lytic transglycosylase G
MRRALWIFSIGLVLLAAWVVISLFLPYRGFSVSGVYVDVPHGASRRTIAGILARQGVVRDRWVFEALSRWRSRRTLQAGEYFFDRPMTAFEVFDALANGRVFVRELVVPEGYSMFDIAELLETQNFMSREEFLAAARDPAPIRDLAPDAPTLEGFLFPATYKFPRHPSGREVVDAMLSRFREEWSKLSAEQQDPSPLSLEQVVTLASLVERETPKPDERPLVAGVFMNRLRRSLPLQCDPTVVYALELAGRYGGRLEAGDLPFPSPYNTYRHIGLPPGPIANPGEASLRAAMAPADTPYLYFVADAEGGHFFGKTLAEHLRNIAQYRRRLAAERGTEQSSGAQHAAVPGPSVPRWP